VLENQERFNSLSPQKQQEMREAAKNWARLTPEQQNHIKNDLLPEWKQLSQARRNAIKNRLGVLQNMPELARNQHLNDPNFTRGMSEEDKALLRDLSHMPRGRTGLAERVKQSIVVSSQLPVPNRGQVRLVG
jgi:Protein of unknown function (DUF3106)